MISKSESLAVVGSWQRMLAAFRSAMLCKVHVAGFNKPLNEGAPHIARINLGHPHFTAQLALLCSSTSVVSSIAGKCEGQRGRRCWNHARRGSATPSP